MVIPIVITSVAAIPLAVILLLVVSRVVLRLHGLQLVAASRRKRDALVAGAKEGNAGSESRQEYTSEEEDWENVNGGARTPIGQPSPDQDWNGIIGFFHPFCNAGGGGERVLWAAIAATQRRWPHACCAVYTGDHGVNRAAIVSKAKERFNIVLREHTLHLVYLSKRHYVLASTYPYFTLLGQSLGSVVLAYEAFNLLVPDIFIDTMGYAFALAFCKYLFPAVPVAAYVHYPTISTDMLESLDDATGLKGLNAGTGAGWRGRLKKYYWHAFAWLYGWVGGHIDVVMCNSSWTSGHISRLWKNSRGAQSFAIVYPPCPVKEVENKIELSKESESKRENIILYIAQFRPEKNHMMILRAFAKYHSTAKDDYRLVLIGSVRANTSDEKLVYGLRLEARAQKINDVTDFICDAPFSLILEYLQKANISTNGMYNEHFGIGNVEGITAGCIPVVNDSGGPRLDIVVPFEGQAVGYLANTEEEYAAGFQKVARLSKEDRLAMRLRGRESMLRFSDEVFAGKWLQSMEELLKMQMAKQPVANS